MKEEERDSLLSLASPGEDWAARTLRLTGGLEEPQGAMMLAGLSAEYRARGKAQLAADTDYLLARRYPHHPLADSALLALVRHYASSESALRLADSQSQSAGLGATKVDMAPPAPADSAGTGATHEHPLRAEQLGDYLAQSRPDMHAEPRMRFCLAAAKRALGEDAMAQTLLSPLTRVGVAPDWRRCALLEEWLEESRDTLRPPPKPTVAAQRLANRPMLDGKLDEPFWQSAAVAQLVQQNDAPQARVRVAYDDQFLYFSVDAEKLPGAAYPEDGSMRPRDGDLRGYDRVVLRLDAGRDYATALELTVDCRGWTHDRSGDDVTWNPRWYVAWDADLDSWRIEAAIPLDQLVLCPPQPGDAWAVGMQREAPGRLKNAWTGAALEDGSPDAFGALLFE